MKIPLPSTTQIKRLSQTVTTSIDEFVTLLKNVTTDLVDGTPTATRRKGVLVLETGDASEIPISPTYGRGVASPPIGGANIVYYANYNTIYDTVYTSAIGTFGAGSDAQKSSRVHFASVDDGTYDMVALDYSVDMGAALDYSIPTFTSITAALPSNLNAGGEWLNGRLFVPSENKIYNSDLNDVTAGYTDFVSAERSSDVIKAIAKHHDHIIAFGSESLEFFYHAEDPGATGSPLRRRQDVYYAMGLLNTEAFAAVDDVVYFLGSSPDKGPALYKVENFQIAKISDTRFNRWLASHYTLTSNDLFYLTAFPYEGRTLVAITYCYTSTPGATAELTDSIYTFVFEADGRMYVWDLDGVSELDNFPIVDFTTIDNRITAGVVLPGTELTYRGIMANGDLVNFKTRWSAPDTFKDDLGTTEAAFTSAIEFDGFDGDATAWKFCNAVEPYGDFETGCTFNLSWSDEGGAYNTPRVLTKANRQRAVSCGRFSRRKFRLTSTDDSDAIDEHMELEGLDADIELGSY